MAVNAISATEIAVKKALEAFRKDLMPVLTLDLKTQFVAQVKQEVGAQLREDLRKEMKQLSSKVAKEISASSDTMKHLLTEQVRKIEHTNERIESSSMKAIKQPLKTKPGVLRASAVVKASALQNKARKPGSRKPVIGLPVGFAGPIADGYLSREDTAMSSARLLQNDARDLEVAAAEALPTLAMGALPTLETPGQIAVDAILNNDAFDICMAVVILIGAIMMAISLQYGIHDNLAVYDAVTAVLFSAELMARFFCYRWDFFRMEGCEWNIFDLIIVSCQLISVASQTSSAFSGLKSLRSLRGLRAIRSLRVLRALRLLRFVEEFRAVVASVLASLKSTLGVLLLFTFGLFLFGACITSEVLEETQAAGADNVNPLLVQYFGTLSSSMLSLYESVTGGLAWSVALNVFLEEEDYMMAFAYLVFIALCVFVLLNVVTAIFAGQALLALQDDQDAMIVKDIDMLFRKGDLKTGDITLEEFQSMLSVPEMVRLFKALNIDVSEARQLYRLLDTENVGVVDYNDFINGCLRLRGPAKSLELVLLMRDSAQMNAFTEKKLNTLSADLHSMQFVLSVVSQQIQLLTSAPTEDDSMTLRAEPTEE
eukprot:TRINITY_DN7613_c0_g1_i1.p1 TRINITY_DN7613_c0_g1~~TRINITY_DN7613_c0_g1_i1.p1  ORF type:complete len:628 (-),score=131.38 TRINITY_DN7613_c0_g1_i1:335-2128(-)